MIDHLSVLITVSPVGPGPVLPAPRPTTTTITWSSRPLQRSLGGSGGRLCERVYRESGYRGSGYRGPSGYRVSQSLSLVHTHHHQEALCCERVSQRPAYASYVMFVVKMSCKRVQYIYINKETHIQTHLIRCWRHREGKPCTTIVGNVRLD